MKKYALIIALSLLFGTGLLVINYLHNTKIPRLYFEHTCPDSAGQQPVFTWENLSASYLETLRLKFGLSRLVANCRTELEKILTVTNWVNSLWEHQGDATPVAADAVSILIAVLEQGKQFRCVEYSIVIAGCLNALGIPSRILRLRTADVETRQCGAGHVVVEAYLATLENG